MHDVENVKNNEQDETPNYVVPGALRNQFESASDFQKCRICRELLEASANGSAQLDWVVLDELGVSGEEFNGYSDVYRTYCHPWSDTFPQFDIAYLDSINFNALNTFRPHLEQWYEDTSNGIPTSCSVTPTSISVLIQDEEEQFHFIDLREIQPDDRFPILYRSQVRDRADLELVHDFPEFDESDVLDNFDDEGYGGENFALTSDEEPISFEP